MASGDRIAIIDLGSNSFRLVVFTAADGWWQRTDEIYQPVRIGEGMAATGRLGEAPMERALATLDVFAHFCRAGELEGEAIDAVATSAIRDAENAADFLARARERTSLPIRVLSREAEARYGYLAAVNSTTLTDGCVLDLGGGSMQLVRVADRLARESGSWRLGAVRMTERFLPGGGPAKRRQLQELRDHVARELQDAPWLSRAGRRLVGIGGTVRNLAVAAQRAAGMPSNGVQGAVVTRAALEELVGRLAALPACERSGVPGIKPGRADLILAGAVVVQGALAAGGFDALEVTEAGLREGVFFERYLSDWDSARPRDLTHLRPSGHTARSAGSGRVPPTTTTTTVDRPPLFDDVRRASVWNLAARCHVDEAHTRHVSALALGMFDQLARLGLHEGDPGERELLWAACVLHDIGMSVDYDDHHKHSRYLILNGGLPGFSPREVAIVAQAARYHRKGLPEPGPLAALFEEGDAQRLDRCAVLLRLAEDLERSRDQLVRDTVLTLIPGLAEAGGGAASGNGTGEALGGEVQLRLLAEGQSAVPRWAASREGELFARAFHRELSVVA
jgi:exopolyphosphatase / guanosine-5'-triphosphate,3'-diphosphate pyrophosphatase